MTGCPICRQARGEVSFHGVAICASCREDQRIVDRRLTWILLVCGVVILLCAIRLLTR